MVVARAILGEWLGGSGGGWQDSGGVFPGVKVIKGVAAAEGDPEWQVSRGRLLPEHELLRDHVGSVDGPATKVDSDTTSRDPQFESLLARSLVLVHGGMAQNVGPILNMVTEKYLLRSGPEWEARQEALRIFEGIVQAVQGGDVRRIGELTTANWEGPLKGIIPWVSNAFTEAVIAESSREFGGDFWGFLMLGGMSGGGMGFFVDPMRHAEFRERIGAIMSRVKGELDDALPFAMEPVVYDFAINPRGTWAELKAGVEATMPARYYTLQVPRLIADRPTVDELRKLDLNHFANQPRGPRRAAPRLPHDDPQPLPRHPRTGRVGHVELGSGRRADQAGERLRPGPACPAPRGLPARSDRPLPQPAPDRHRHPRRRGRRPDRRGPALRPCRGSRSRKRSGAVGWRSSRWPRASGVAGRPGRGSSRRSTRSSRWKGGIAASWKSTWRRPDEAQERHGSTIPHVVTTSFLTHQAIARHLERTRNYGHDGPVVLSPGMSIGQRLIPMARSLTFLWEETPHELLDENKQKVREASRRAILDWARSVGRGGRLHRQRPDPAVQSAGPLLRGPEPPPQRRPRPPARRPAGPAMVDGPQHRHPRRRRRSRVARPGDRVGCDLDLRGGPPPDRRPRRRPGAGQRAGPAARRAGGAAGGRRVPPPLLQHADDLGGHRPPARRLRPVEVGPPVQPREGGRRPSASWRLGCRPT